MTLKSDNRSLSLRKQADGLELKLAGRHRMLRFRIDRIKRAVMSRIASPTALVVGFGVGVVLEKTGDRRKDSLAYLLNSAYASARLLVSLSTMIRAFNRSHLDNKPDNVHPI